MSIGNVAAYPSWVNPLVSQTPVYGRLAVAVGQPGASGATPAGGSASGSRAVSAAPGGSLLQDILATLEKMVSQSGGTSASTTLASATASGALAGGATATTGGATASAGGAVSSQQTQDLQNFMASLMQALHQAGQGATNGVATAGGAATSALTASAATAAAGSAATSAASLYQAHGHGHGHGGHGHLSSQLQALIDEVDGDSSPSTTGAAATGPQSVSNLESSFQTLMQDLSANAAGATSGATTGAGTSATTPASAPSLQQFLQTLMQNLQNQGTAAQSTGLLLNAVA